MKNLLRNQLSPELLDVIMRIKQSKDTWDTFDATRATELWTSTNHLICDHKVNSARPTASPNARPTQRPTQAPATERPTETCSNMKSEVERIELEHEYLISNKPTVTLVDKKPRTECFFIFNKKNGKALTAHGDEVVLWTWNSEEMDMQLWFWHGEHLVSRSTQKVLEADPSNEQRVYLNYYHQHVSRQKWSKYAWIQSLDFEFKSRYQNYRLDVIENLTENGAIVGTAKARNSVTQRWKVEEVRDYEN